LLFRVTVRVTGVRVREMGYGWGEWGQGQCWVIKDRVSARVMVAVKI